jgi:3-hydroxyacyl-CoA dehydrogenase/enoyl-CoA hydratase/3-hydroxybutyryl-CoA epimerase
VRSTSHDNEIIRYAVDEDGIAMLTLDYPGKTMNVIDQASWTAWRPVSHACGDDRVRGGIITSGKDSFVAGADLMGMEANIDAMADMPIEELFASCASLSRLLRKLETLGKPLVAAINGMALGGGYEICLACHHRIAADAPTVMVGCPRRKWACCPAPAAPSACRA